MSDERDSADAAGDDAASTGQTAVVTQPVRPTGKRSRRVVSDGDDADSTTDTAAITKNGSGSKPKVTKKSSGSSRNPFVYAWTFLQQVIAELRKVIWPNRKQMISYTSVVLVFLAFMVTMIGVVDLGLTKLVVLVFG